MIQPHPNVAALFVDGSERGIYPKLLGRGHCWAGDPEKYPGSIDDAREYDQRMPVVAHPPCNLWVNMAAVNWKRYGRQRPAWYPGGTDGGCFAAARAAVRKHGGVLEHPAGSHAWPHPFPQGHDGPRGWTGGVRVGWMLVRPGEWQCDVWQSAYGHLARKRTWLLYRGKRPPYELNWTREPGTHQCGWFDRIKPSLHKREASATPEAFARELIKPAAWSRGTDNATEV